MAESYSLRDDLRMEAGEGEASYSQNSAIQGAMVHDTGPHLAEAIQQVSECLSGEKVVRVADFGCSVGANALAWAHRAVTSVLAAAAAAANSNSSAAESSAQAPEIHYFFSDLPSNDFSSLFRDLLQATERNYFAAAVGGSFHDRLFPSGSLHIAISTWSLHWMSKVPEAVLDIRSPAYNKGQAWIQGGNAAAAEAYAEVARQDLLNFFTHRAYELAPGGLLFAVFICRAGNGPPHIQTSDEFHQAYPGGGLLDSALEDLVVEGVIEAEERDLFNIPVYHASMEEIEEAISKTGAYDIKRLEVQRDYQWLTEGSQQLQYFKDNPKVMGAMAKNFVRAYLNPLMEAHLGPSRAIRVWERLELNVTAYVQRTHNIFLTMPGINYALVVLSRK